MDILFQSLKNKNMFISKSTCFFFEIKFLKINCEAGIVTAFFQIDFYVESCTDFNIFCFGNGGKIEF